MKKQTIKFLENIRNFKIKRELGETDEETIKRFHKTRLILCYDYLKLLMNLKNGCGLLQEDYNQVKKITLEFEQEYLRWTREKDN